MKCLLNLFAKAPLFIANLVMLTAGVFNVGLGTYFLFKSDSTMGIASLTAGLVLLLAATIDRFETLKGLGLEAKTRQLTHTIAEAQATLVQLRELAELSGEATVQLTSSQGRLSAPTVEQSYLTSRRVKDMLQKVGSQKEKIRAIMQPWAKFSTIDAFISVINELRHQLSTIQKNKLDERATIHASDPADARIEKVDRAIEKLTAMEQSLNRVGDKVEGPDDATRYFKEILLGAEQIDPMVHAAATEVIEPWLRRLTYLRDNLDLNDQQAWFSMRRY